MKTLKFKMTGMAPLLMHNERLANPADPITRQMKAITSKLKKTDDDLIRLQELEWVGGLYATEHLEFKDGAPVGGGRVAIKGNMIEAMLAEAAKEKKNGKKTFKAGVFVDVDSIPLEYKGPQEIGKLFKDPAFRDIRGAKVQSSKVMRMRPKFNQWTLTGEVCYLPEVINESAIKEAFTRAGLLVGLGDFRPRYGRFNVEFPN
jgi:hypothetical protein